MKGIWIQDKNETWHLITTEPTTKKDKYMSWCAKEFDLEAVVRQGALLGFMDIVHDECVRKSEELE